MPFRHELRAGVSDTTCFVRTVDLGSFAAVGAETGLTPSGVSRIITRLESRLGVKLLHRTTRRLSLTPEGETFLAHARGILRAVEAAEAAVASTHGRARGHIRLNSGTAFAKHKLARLLPDFFAQYPDITIDVSVSDQRIVPISERVDVTACRQRAHRRAARRGPARYRSQPALPRSPRNSAEAR